MGTQLSSNNLKRSEEIDIEKIHVGSDDIATHLPIYYIAQRPSKYEIMLAEQSWKMISEDLAPNFLYNIENMTRNSFRFISCIEWFEHLFFKKLFEALPESKPLFPEQEKRLNALFGFVFKGLDNESTFNTKLSRLALLHCYRGVQTRDYNIMGEVIFWSLERVLGPAYTAEVNVAWIKIYSWMLSVIIPVTLAYPRMNESLEKRSNSSDNDPSTPKVVDVEFSQSNTI